MRFEVDDSKRLFAVKECTYTIQLPACGILGVEESIQELFTVFGLDRHRDDSIIDYC